MSPAGRPAQTSPEAWVQAALDEIEEAGVGALSVQSVARRLSVSKGGLYHHFEDRRALLRAALDLWERRFVIELVERFDEIADPRDRLRALLDYSGVELEPTVIVQLMAAAGDPDVAARLRRAADSRMALLQRIFRELGLSSAVARDRAAIAYSAYLGLAQLRIHAPGELHSPERRRSYLRELESELLQGCG